MNVALLALLACGASDEPIPPTVTPPSPDPAQPRPFSALPTPNGEKATAEHPNIILIDIDSLRADRLDTVRDGAPIAPTLQALARAGTRFDATYSQSGWTTPALMSILRGRSPLLHNGKGNEMKLIGEGERPVPDILELYGYSTLTLFALHRWMDDPRAGLGFQRAVFFPEDDDTDLDGQLVRQVSDAMPQVREPFFLLLHHFDVDKFPDRLPLEALHRFLPDSQGCTKTRYDEAYDQLLPVLGEDAAKAHVISHYDATLAWYDAVLGRILDNLRTSGVIDRSIVMLTSNHGEDLFEHFDTVNHCSLYDSVLHVPLLIVDPKGTPGTVLQAPVQTMDLAPTILAYAGVPVDAGMEGRSLVPLVRGDTVDWPARPVFSATNKDNISVRAEGWKLISTDHPSSNRASWPCGKDKGKATPTWELFDLSADASELNDLYTSRPEKAAAAEKVLTDWRDTQAALTEGAPTYTVGAAAKEAMQQQGYWGVVSSDGKQGGSGGSGGPHGPAGPAGGTAPGGNGPIGPPGNYPPPPGQQRVSHPGATPGAAPTNGK
jgi:arylsulfatase A-like enzyme